MDPLKRLRIDHWAWVQAKIVLCIWGLDYLFDPPPGSREELGALLVIISATFVVIGSIVSIVGIVISTGEVLTARYKGLAIEAAGLIFATCGPLVFFIIQVVRVPNGPQYFSRALFAYVLAAFMMARTVVVLRALKKGQTHGT